MARTTRSQTSSMMARSASPLARFAASRNSCARRRAPPPLYSSVLMSTGSLPPPPPPPPSAPVTLGPRAPPRRPADQLLERRGAHTGGNHLLIDRPRARDIRRRLSADGWSLRRRHECRRAGG